MSGLQAPVVLIVFRQAGSHASQPRGAAPGAARGAVHRRGRAAAGPARRGGPVRRRTRADRRDRLAVQGAPQVRRPQPRARGQRGARPRLGVLPGRSRDRARGRLRSRPFVLPVRRRAAPALRRREADLADRRRHAPGAEGDVRRRQLWLQHLGQRVGLGDLGRPLARPPRGVRPGPRRRRGPGRRDPAHRARPAHARSPYPTRTRWSPRPPAATSRSCPPSRTATATGGTTTGG